jgi:hypothetical protein
MEYYDRTRIHKNNPEGSNFDTWVLVVSDTTPKDREGQNPFNIMSNNNLAVSHHILYHAFQSTNDQIQEIIKQSPDRPPEKA